MPSSGNMSFGGRRTGDERLDVEVKEEFDADVDSDPDSESDSSITYFGFLFRCLLGTEMRGGGSEVNGSLRRFLAPAFRLVASRRTGDIEVDGMAF
jgi:hypothetical protein